MRLPATVRPPPLLAILSLALGLLAWPPAAAAQDGTASLVGSVTSVGSDTPVEGVEVVLVEVDRTAVSGADGRFRFAELAPGSHALDATVRRRPGGSRSSCGSARSPT